MLFQFQSQFPMEAFVRIFNSSNRHFCNSILLKSHPHHSPFPFPPSRSPHIPHHSIQTKPCFYNRTHSSFPRSSLSKSLGLIFQSLSSSLTSSNTLTTTDPFTRITSLSDNKPLHWNLASHGINGHDRGFVENNKEPIVTVVLLGWLGSKHKHLRRYAELYNSRGIPAITLVAPVKDLLSLDFGRRFQRRISALAFELTSWLSEREKDGRERFLLFHTFSNTGWLAYGAILDGLQGRPDLLKRIKGCVFDSGGDRNINPKVWAAGFAAALLKKCSSATYPSAEAGEENVLESGMTVSKMGKKEPLLVEVILLLLLEKLFSFLLNMPDINLRLTKIISGLSKNQPPCPQLYLYSTADKVIPYQSVESFMEEQKKMGRKVWSFNFGSSPHVDHYRTFPTIYRSQLQTFLKVCLDMVKQM